MKNIEDKELLNLLLNYQEWYKFECKRAAVKPSKLLETAIAFANTDGGIIVVGLEDASKAKGQNRVLGISENPDNTAEFIKLIEKEIDPSIKAWVKFDLSVINSHGVADKLLICIIKKSDDVHSLKNGDTFVRRGNQNVKIGSQEIIRLKYEKGALKFEDESSGIYSLEDLDMNLLEQFKKDVQGDKIDTWQLLKDTGLAIKKGNEHELTKAGALIFAKNPSILLRGKYGIKISHYYGNKPDFSGEPNFLRRPFSIQGPLIKQIDEALKYFQEVVKLSPPKLKQSAFKSSLIIPEWAFQEAVTNAVIHRNYAMADDIQIRFFDNRIEIESPGSLPGHITVNNILTERYARNPIILNTLNRFSMAPNLDIGEGVNRMFKEMKEKNLIEPNYSTPYFRPNTVLLVLFNLEAIGYWDTINNYLDKHNRVTNKIARQITGIEDTLKMSRLLKTWVDDRLLEKIGINDKKAVYYVKPGRDIPPELFSEANDN